MLNKIFSWAFRQNWIPFKVVLFIRKLIEKRELCRK